jgi:hypothetical protein
MCATGLSCWGLAFNTGRLSAPVNLLLAVLLFAANWWQARHYYRIRLVKLECFRRDHLELLDRARPGS